MAHFVTFMWWYWSWVIPICSKVTRIVSSSMKSMVAVILNLNSDTRLLEEAEFSLIRLTVNHARVMGGPVSSKLKKIQFAECDLELQFRKRRSRTSLHLSDNTVSSMHGRQKQLELYGRKNDNNNLSHFNFSTMLNHLP